MRLAIRHELTYTYSQPVELAPHLLRLRPRSDSNQRLDAFAVAVDPQPVGSNDWLDLDGNTVRSLWFAPEATSRLTVCVTSQVETLLDNPFNFLLDPAALRLPADYPASLYARLRPYLGDRLGGDRLDPVAVELAQTILDRTGGHTLDFLSDLNQTLYQTCAYEIRDSGDPRPPGDTWRRKAGSCRDLAVLFGEVCRAVDLAARFVSGYELGDPALDRHLHAWAEVYLPGAGWRGYDPTQGILAADRHIALVASPNPSATAPLPGAFRGRGATAALNYSLSLDPVATQH